MLMSINEAPISTPMSAARAIRSCSRPKICTPNGRPLSEGVSLSMVLRAPSVSALAERNSVMVRPTPSSSHTVRKGRSVTAAMGARTTSGVTCKFAIRIDFGGIYSRNQAARAWRYQVPCRRVASVGRNSASS